MAQNNSYLGWIFLFFYAKNSIEVTFAALATKKGNFSTRQGLKTNSSFNEIKTMTAEIPMHVNLL